MPSTAPPPSRTTPTLLHRPRRRHAVTPSGDRGRAWRHRRLLQPSPGGGPGGRTVRDGAPRILVVDDETPIRTICRVNLEASGMHVVEAGNGEEALERIRAEQPSLVLLDVMMPGVDGWSVAERLASDPATRELPVVFLSARADTEDRAQAHRLGAVGYIVKPFDPVALSGRLERVLERVRRGEREQLREEVLEGA